MSANMPMDETLNSINDSMSRLSLSNKAVVVDVCCATLTDSIINMCDNCFITEFGIKHPLEWSQQINESLSAIIGRRSLYFIELLCDMYLEDPFNSNYTAEERLREITEEDSIVFSFIERLWELLSSKYTFDIAALRYNFIKRIQKWYDRLMCKIIESQSNMTYRLSNSYNDVMINMYIETINKDNVTCLRMITTYHNDLYLEDNMKEFAAIAIRENANMCFRLIVDKLRQIDVIEIALIKSICDEILRYDRAGMFNIASDLIFAKIPLKKCLTYMTKFNATKCIKICKK